MCVTAGYQPEQGSNTGTKTASTGLSIDVSFVQHPQGVQVAAAPPWWHLWLTRMETDGLQHSPEMHWSSGPAVGLLVLGRGRGRWVCAAGKGRQ